MLVAIIINGNNTTSHNHRDCIAHIPHFIDGKSGVKLWAYLFFFKTLLIPLT